MPVNSDPSSISRRLADCLAAYERKEYEIALIHYFPALDKTAKRRRPKVGVGERIRSFLQDEEAVISAIATGNVLQGITVDGMTFDQAIYEFGRNAIAHEGELDPRLEFTDGGDFIWGKALKLPSRYILGLCVSVIISPECKQERLASSTGRVNIFGRSWEINQMFGAEKEVKEHMEAVFRRPRPFN